MCYALQNHAMIDYKTYLFAIIWHGMSYRRIVQTETFLCSEH